MKAIEPQICTHGILNNNSSSASLWTNWKYKQFMQVVVNRTNSKDWLVQWMDVMHNLLTYFLNQGYYYPILYFFLMNEITLWDVPFSSGSSG